MLPRPVRGQLGSMGRYSVLVNNVPQNGVCIGDTCREVEFWTCSHSNCTPAREAACQNSRSKVDPQSRSPEQKNRISSDRTEETVVKARKGKTPAAPPKWHAGQPALQCNAKEHLETLPNIKRENHFTMPGEHHLMVLAAEAAAVVGSRSDQEDLRKQPGCRLGEVHGIHLCRHGHRGSLQSCSRGSASRNPCPAACQPAGLIAMHIAVAV
jgi:hypothetical protein